MQKNRKFVQQLADLFTSMRFDWSHYDAQFYLLQNDDIYGFWYGKSRAGLQTRYSHRVPDSRGKSHEEGQEDHRT